MIVTCESCGLSYSPSMLKCPSCGNFETPPEMLREWAKEEASRLIAEKWTNEEVIKMLKSYRYDHYEAELLVQESQQAIRQENRSDGMRRCFWSGLLMLFAIAAIFSRVSIFVSGGILLASSVAFLNGLLAVLTGRDDLVTPD